MPIIHGSHSGSSKLQAVGQVPPIIAVAAVGAGADNDQPGLTPPVSSQSVPIPNRSFGYLTINPAQVDANAILPSNNAPDVIKALKALGSAMIEDSDTETEDSIIPPVYTYWGQFIDHDITAGTDRSTRELFSIDILDEEFTPVAPAIVVGEEGLVNLRLPELELDSVYGDGPNDPATQQVGIFLDNLHLAVGPNTIPAGFEERTPNPQFPEPLNRDLPRNPNRRAKVADDRNDENTIIAQFHTAFLRFHNQVVASLPKPDFAEANRLVRWHYQWLVVNDYLRTICKDGIVDEILFSDSGFFQDATDRFMPLEFSVAGYRFGHSMVRADYDFNRNFGRDDNPHPPQPQLDRARFALLFTFTGLKGNLGGNPTLPNNWIIEWERFTDKNSAHSDRFARKIDTNLAFALTEIPADTDANTGVQPPIGTLTTLQKHLAQRNLLRSYLLSLPTGQHVAAFFGVPALSEEELVPANKPAVEAALNAENGLLKQKTPLWYYILREAEVKTNGNSLGEVGSRLVAGTLIGLLKADPGSYLNDPAGWNPAKGMKLPNGKPIVRIMDLFRFAGVA